MSAREGLGSPEQLWVFQGNGMARGPEPLGVVSGGFVLSLQTSEGVCLGGRTKGWL